MSDREVRKEDGSLGEAAPGRPRRKDSHSLSNLHCALGISLEACLHQCLLIPMPPTHSNFLVTHEDSTVFGSFGPLTWVFAQTTHTELAADPQRCHRQLVKVYDQQRTLTNLWSSCRPTSATRVTLGAGPCRWVRGGCRPHGTGTRVNREVGGKKRCTMIPHPSRVRFAIHEYGNSLTYDCVTPARFVHAHTHGLRRRGLHTSLTANSKGTPTGPTLTEGSQATHTGFTQGLTGHTDHAETTYRKFAQARVVYKAQLYGGVCLT